MAGFKELNEEAVRQRIDDAEAAVVRGQDDVRDSMSADELSEVIDRLNASRSLEDQEPRSPDGLGVQP